MVTGSIGKSRSVVYKPRNLNSIPRNNARINATKLTSNLYMHADRDSAHTPTYKVLIFNKVF